MKTQISRWSDAPRKRRAGLYQQQGRIISDADLNELTELLKRRIDEALGEVIGSGAPRAGNPGLIENGPLIRRGALYVDGIRAQLESTVAGTAPFALDTQADFPAPPPYPTGATSVYLYADVWEQCLTGAQDPSMLDPALNGADTATRTQTLAQVKWCPATVHPVSDPKNPAHGDATVGLSIREGSSAADPCDPCAAEIALDSRVGNYLFRLEVHDVGGPADAPQSVTIKWSSENAAEQHPTASAPSEFKRGDWIYEFFNDVTEKQLGVHLAPGFTPTRAPLIDGWPSSLEGLQSFSCVRRWDGFAVLVKNGAVWSVRVLNGALNAKDRGRVFEVLPQGATPTHGHVSYQAPSFTFSLSGLTLTLGIDGRKVVAGDYWLATIREAAEAAARVQLTSSTPIGIQHHYVILAQATGATVQALSEADIRRLSFPKLTDLSADRVGYSPVAQAARWTDVIDDVNVPAPLNVQRAIDLLLERLESSDISCLVTNCGTAASPSVRSLLGIVPGQQKLDTILGKLLCDFNATDLPIDKSDATLAPILNVPSVSSVQQALSLLATAFTGQQCEATVGAGGQFASLADAFAAFAAGAATDLSLCLLPGVHNLPAAISISGKRSLKISGVGAYASRVTLGATLQLTTQEVVVRDVGIVGQGTGSMVLQADRVVATNSAWARATVWNPHVWSKKFGTSGNASSTSVTVDASGNVIVTGSFAGTADFGNGPISTDPDSDGPTTAVFLAKYNSTGTHQWSKRLGGFYFDAGAGVVADTGGNILLTGSFFGKINLGGAEITAETATSTECFLAKFDAAGAHVWSKRLRASNCSVAVDGSGNVVVTGRFSGTSNFGGVNLVSVGTSDIFVAKYNAAGVHQWSKRGGGAGPDVAPVVAVDASGNVLLTGAIVGNTNLGGSDLICVGNSDVFLLKLNSAGTHLWSKNFGVAGGNGTGQCIAVDANGNVIFAGFCTSGTNFGGGALVGGSVAPLNDTFLARFDTNGAHVWSKRFTTGASGSEWVSGVAAEPGGNVVIVGGFGGGTINLGGADFPSLPNAQAIYMARFDALGNHLASNSFAAGLGAALGMCLDASNNVLVAGRLLGSIIIGSTTLNGDRAALLAKLMHEPALSPLVTLRPRQANRGLDLLWTDNDMLVTATDGTTPAQTRVALALATQTVGGAVTSNTIEGQLLLLGDFPLDLNEAASVTVGTTGVGGGAYLSIRGNDIARIASRYENSAPTFDGYGTVDVSDNTIVEPNNGVLCESLTMNNNRFLTRAAADLIGVAVARQATVIGNQATHLQAALRVLATNCSEAGNLLTVTRPAYPSFQSNSAAPWYFGGVGADLL